jgi:hypothetical protein
VVSGLKFNMQDDGIGFRPSERCCHTPSGHHGHLSFPASNRFSTSDRSVARFAGAKHCQQNRTQAGTEVFAHFEENLWDQQKALKADQ